MIYFTDGFCIVCNPADEGGYTITDETGKLLKTERYARKNLTNNEVELMGVYVCLRDYAQEGDIIITDSMNTIYWIRKPKSKSRPDLMDTAKDAKRLIEEKKVKLEWQPREENKAGWYNECNYNA